MKNIYLQFHLWLYYITLNRLKIIIMYVNKVMLANKYDKYKIKNNKTKTQIYKTSHQPPKNEMKIWCPRPQWNIMTVRFYLNLLNCILTKLLFTLSF